MFKFLLIALILWCCAPRFYCFITSFNISLATVKSVCEGRHEEWSIKSRTNTSITWDHVAPNAVALLVDDDRACFNFTTKLLSRPRDDIFYESTMLLSTHIIHIGVPHLKQSPSIGNIHDDDPTCYPGFYCSLLTLSISPSRISWLLHLVTHADQTATASLPLNRVCFARVASRRFHSRFSRHALCPCHYYSTDRFELTFAQVDEYLSPPCLLYKILRHSNGHYQTGFFHFCLFSCSQYRFCLYRGWIDRWLLKNDGRHRERRFNGSNEIDCCKFSQYHVKFVMQRVLCVFADHLA